MTNLIKQLEDEQIAKLTKNKEIPEFRSGDTVKVGVRIVDSGIERVQNFEGVVISRRNKGVMSSFTVYRSRKESVERLFFLYSPLIEKITVLRKGVVRRAKLYYLRSLTGKAARIEEKIVIKKQKSKDPATS